MWIEHLGPDLPGSNDDVVDELCAAGAADHEQGNSPTDSDAQLAWYSSEENDEDNNSNDDDDQEMIEYDVNSEYDADDEDDSLYEYGEGINVDETEEDDMKFYRQHEETEDCHFNFLDVFVEADDGNGYKRHDGYTHFWKHYFQYRSETNFQNVLDDWRPFPTTDSRPLSAHNGDDYSKSSGNDSVILLDLIARPRIRETEDSEDATDRDERSGGDDHDHDPDAFSAMGLIQ